MASVPPKVIFPEPERPPSANKFNVFAVGILRVTPLPIVILPVPVPEALEVEMLTVAAPPLPNALAMTPTSMVVALIDPIGE